MPEPLILSQKTKPEIEFADVQIHFAGLQIHFARLLRNM
jgi:hypothetical protein